MFLRRSLAIAVLASLLLSSCADDEPKPDIPPPTTSPPSTSATTEPVDPLAYPAEAMEPTKAGAEVLIRHFWDMVNHLLETGDAKPVRQLYGANCDFCESGVSVYIDFLERGDVFEGGDERYLRIKTVLRTNSDGTPGAYAVVRRNTEPETQRDSNGKVVNKFPGGPSTREYFLRFQGGQWEINNIGEPR